MKTYYKFISIFFLFLPSLALSSGMDFPIFLGLGSSLTSETVEGSTPSLNVHALMQRGDISARRLQSILSSFDPQEIRRQLSQRDRHMRTPLYYAIAARRLDFVEILIEEYRVDLDIVDREGISPQALAYNNEFDEIAEYISDMIILNYNRARDSERLEAEIERIRFMEAVEQDEIRHLNMIDESGREDDSPVVDTQIEEGSYNVIAPSLAAPIPRLIIRRYEEGHRLASSEAIASLNKIYPTF